MEELNKDQLSLMKDIYYDKKLFFGRDKLFRYLQDNYPESGISRRQLDRWLKSQATHMIHQRSKSIRDIKTQVVSAPHKVLQVDLADFQNFAIKGFKYLMVGIDMFSKKVYLVAMKNRTKESILTAFKKIYKRVPQVKTIRSDNEFTNKPYEDFLKKQNVRSVLGEPSLPQSQGQVEKANAVIKKSVSSAILNDDKFDWVKDLKNIEDAINSTYSVGTGETPNKIEELYEADNKDELEKIYDNQKNIKSKQGRIAKAMFEVGDMVRKFDFEREGTAQFKSRKWSVDVYEIERVNKPKTDYSPYTYKIKGENKIYKNEELLRVEGNEQPAEIPETFLISKLVRPLIDNGMPAYEVKWKNYKDTTIEPRETLNQDTPKLLSQYEKTNKIRFEKKKGKWKIVKS